MTTIGSPVYCGNSNYPLWLANGRPIDSPVTVINNGTKAFTITVDESNATTSYNDYPATTQAYAGIVYSKDGGIGSNSALLLQTNGQTNIALNGGGNVIQTFRPIQVTNEENNFLQVTPEAISLNGVASNAITITDGGGFSIGNTVDITSQVFAVYNAANNTEADLKPDSLTFGTYANTTSNISQDFSGQVLAGPSYQAIRPTFGGITWTTSGGTPADAGITRVNPALSSKAVTTSGAAFPGINAQCVFLGNQYPAYPQPIGTYNGFIMPTLSVAQPGEIVTLSYDYAGGQSGRILVNSILTQTIPASAVWVSASTTFISTGNDEVEFQVQTIPYTGNASQFNITNIVFSYTIASVSVPRVGIAVEAVLNPSNYGTLNLASLSNGLSNIGSYIQVGDTYNGISLIATSNTSSLLLNTNASLTATGTGATVSLTSSGSGASMTLTSPTVTVSGTLNMSSNPISNCPSVSFTGGGSVVGSSANTLSITASNISNVGSVSNVGNFTLSSGNILMGGNSLTGASNLTTSNLDAVSNVSNIIIGSNSGASFLYKLSIMEGLSGGATLSNIKYLNNDAACATGIFHYLVSFDGTKAVSAPLPPKQVLTGRNNNTFGSNYSGDSFVSSVGFTLPAYSIFTYSNISGSGYVFSNTNTIPYYYADTGAGFSPSSSSQVYSLVPIIV